MGHIVLDLTSLTYQLTTKSSNRSGHPKKQVIFAMSERKPADLAQAPDMHEDEDDKPLVRPTTRKEPLKGGRDRTIGGEDLATLVRDLLSHTATAEKKTTSAVRSNWLYWNKVSRDSRERTEETSIFAKKTEGEALRNIIHKLSDHHNLKDLRLKHHQMSSAQ